jgi:hypothetical protein
MKTGKLFFPSHELTLNGCTHLPNPVNQDAALSYENMVFENSCSRTVAEKEKGLPANTVSP